MKKTYIKPIVKTVKMYGGHLLAGGSGNEVNSSMSDKAKAYSRESSIWDEEEEEDNLGGWFK